MTDDKSPKITEVEDDSEDSEESGVDKDGSFAGRELHGEEELDLIYSESAGSREDEDAETEAIEDVPAQGPNRRKQRPQNSEDVMSELLVERAAQANERLRVHLAVSILVDLASSGRRYLFDGRTWPAKVSKLEKSSASSANVDCELGLDDDTLLRIANGVLNPQMAMLSDLVRVKGKFNAAVYFFNLIAPQPRH